MNSYKIKNIDNIRSIVYHNRDIKKDNENKKLNTKKDNINIFSSSNKKTNNKIYSYNTKIKLDIKTTLKKDFYNIFSKNKNNNNNYYLSNFLRKQDSVYFAQSNRELSYQIKKEGKKTKNKLLKIKKDLFYEKIFDEKKDDSSMRNELKNQINQIKLLNESSKKIISTIKKSYFFSKTFKDIIEEKKNSQNKNNDDIDNNEILNKNHISGTNIMINKRSKKNILKNNKSVNEKKNYRDKSKKISLIRKYYYKLKIKHKKLSFMEDKNILYNSGNFTLPFVYKLMSQRENSKKK